MFTPSSFIVAGEAGTILRTTDSGATWTLQNPPYGLVRLLAITFIGSDTGFVSGEATTGEGKIFKTINGGQTWNELSTGAFTPLLFAMSFVSNTMGWAVGEGGTILKTTNGGATWARQEVGELANFNSVSFADLNSGPATMKQGVVVGDGGIILKTTNNGTTWTRQDGGVVVGFDSNPKTTRSESNGGSVTLFGVKNTPNVSYAVGLSGTILRNAGSLSHGATIRTLRSVWVIDNVAIACGDGGTIVRTSDNGTTWNLIPSGTTSSLRFIHFSTATDGIIVGVNGAVLRTTNGGATWSLKNRGFSTTLNNVAAHSDKTVFAVGVSGTIVKTTNQGASWVPVTSGASQNLNSLAIINNTVVVVGNGTLLRSTDKGITWQQRPSGTLNGIHFSSSTHGIAVGALGSVLRTSDAGATWDSSTAGTTATLNKVFVLDASFAVAVGNSGALRITTDGGQTWNQAERDTANLLHDVTFVRPAIGIAVGGALAPGIPPVMLRTIDSGKIWPAVNLTGVVAGQDLRSLYFLNPDTGYALGTGGVVIKTTNAGISWQRLQSSTNQTLNDMVFLDATTGFVVGANGTIMSTMYVTQTSVPSSSIVEKPQFYLSPNYPNPFNPSTTIRFHIPFSGRAILSVYNLLGQRISIIFDGDVHSDEAHSILFEAESLPSGIYYYRLEAGLYSVTRPMILLR